jgi:hypothetical protein
MLEKDLSKGLSFADTWRKQLDVWGKSRSDREAARRGQILQRWNFAQPYDFAIWTRTGVGLEDTEPASSGEFVVDIDLTVEEYKPLDVQALHYRHEHFKVGDKKKDAFIDAAELAGSHNKQAWFAILSKGIGP